MKYKKIILLSALICSTTMAQVNGAKPGSSIDTRAPVADLMGTNSEGFEDITNLPGWVMDNQSSPVGSADWFQGNGTSTFPAQAGGTDEYIAVNYNSTAGSDICNWLVLPDLGFLQTLSFWTRTATGSTWPDRLFLLHSPTGGTTTGDCFTDFGDFTNSLVEVNPALVTGGYPEDWTQFTSNINATGRFAFVYFVADGGPTGNNSNYIGIDSVEWVAGSPEADMGITKTNNASGSTVVGDTVTYSLTVVNNGPGTATNATVTDTLPAQVTYVSNTCGATHSGGTVTWAIGAMANAATSACDIVVAVNTSGSINNTASISADEDDNVSSNDSSSTSFSAGVPSADLMITIGNDASGSSNNGDTVTFTQTVMNNGPQTANNTIVMSAIPNGLTYVSNSCGATLSGSTLTWNIGVLANGASQMCSVVMTVSGFGQMTFNGSVSADESDVVSSNNASASGVNGPVRIIPTLSQYGLFMLLVGLFFIGRRKLPK